MERYIECRRCEFVLTAGDSTGLVPKHWDACPDCGGTEFGTVSE